MPGSLERLNTIFEAKYYNCYDSFLFSKIPEARTTPMETKIIPKNFIDVIFSSKKITPPNRANTGVRAPKAAV